MHKLMNKYMRDKIYVLVKLESGVTICMN